MNFELLNTAIADSELNASELRVYILMLQTSSFKKDNTIEVYNGFIMDRLNMKERTVRNATNGLAKKGYLEKISRCNSKQKNSNVYKLNEDIKGGKTMCISLPPYTSELSSTNTQEGVQECAQSCASVCPPIDIINNINNKNNNNTTIDDNDIYDTINDIKEKNIKKKSLTCNSDDDVDDLTELEIAFENTRKMRNGIEYETREIDVFQDMTSSIKDNTTVKVNDDNNSNEDENKIKVLTSKIEIAKDELYHIQSQDEFDEKNNTFIGLMTQLKDLIHDEEKYKMIRLPLAKWYLNTKPILIKRIDENNKNNSTVNGQGHSMIETIRPIQEREFFTTEETSHYGRLMESLSKSKEDTINENWNSIKTFFKGLSESHSMEFIQFKSEYLQGVLPKYRSLFPIIDEYFKNNNSNPLSESSSSVCVEDF